MRGSLQRGMTLVEVLTVAGMLVLIGSLALFVSMETYWGTIFRADRDTLIMALQRARAEAINNMCEGPSCTNGKPHGVKILPGAIVVFQGATYATRDTDVDTQLRMNAIAVGADEFVFSQLSGTTSCGSGCAVKFVDHTGHTSYATTTGEGRIYWSN